MMKPALGTCALLVCLAIFATTRATADDTPHELLVWAGAFDTAGPINAEAGWEYRGRQLFWEIRITAGLMITDDAGGQIYSGFRRDFDLRPRWGLSIGSAAGLYEDGHGKDLGGPIEFRSNFEVYRRLGPDARVALVFYHLSNSGIYRHNPGSNSLVLGYAFAPGRR